MYVIYNYELDLFYAGELWDNGTYGSGYKFHQFKSDVVFRFNSKNEAEEMLDQIRKEPDLCSFPVSFTRTSFSEKLGLMADFKSYPITLG